MVSSQKKKIFFWLFGLLLAVFIYFLLSKYSKNPLWVVLAISLVVIFLFYIVGEIVSNISGLYLHLFNKNDPNKIFLLAKEEEDKQKVEDLIKKIKKTMAFVVSQNYSEESIKLLNDYIGISQEETFKLIEITKKLNKVKWTYWLFGLIFTLINIFLIFFIENFNFLKDPIYLPISINIIIFLLFYMVGILTTKLPNKYYLEIFNLKQEKIKDTNIKTKKNLEQKQKLSIESIKTSIRYLLRIRVPKEEIITIMINQGFTRKVADEIISQITEEQINLLKKIPSRKGGALEKVFISKIYEEFINLKEINTEINIIKESLSKVETRQKEIEFNLKRLKNKKQNTVNKIPYSKDDFEPKTTSKTYYQVKREKGYNFSKEVYFLYNLILPQTLKHTKEDIEAFLLYQNYSLDTISDLMELFRLNNINFKENKKENKIVAFINKFFDK